MSHVYIAFEKPLYTDGLGWRCSTHPRARFESEDSDATVWVTGTTVVRAQRVPK